MSAGRVTLGAIAALLLVAGCASQAAKTPPGGQQTAPPVTDSSTAVDTPAQQSDTATVTPTPTEPPPDPLWVQATADTATAGQKVRRCLGRKLLAEEEATVDATLAQLRQAQAAFAQGNLQLAASRARSAKSLSASLRCR
jgi:hypothetical protein